MNKLWSLVLAVMLATSSLQAEAAKRLGGGRSMGQQSSNVTQREAASPAVAPAPAGTAASAPRPAPAPAAATPPARKPWAGMLGGLAAGLGLAWLAHSLGLGEAFGQALLFGLLALVVVGVVGAVLRSRRGAAHGSAGGYAFQGAGSAPVNPVLTPQYNPAKVGNDASARPWESAQAFDGGAAAAGGSMIGSALSGSQNWGIPAGFDAQGFVDAAKRNFITLQAAWDRSDIATLKSMMTDAMLDEIRVQLNERETHQPGQPNTTDVVMLEAKLLGIEDMAEGYMASVEFSGLIREEPSAGPNPFREVWNMTKPKNGQTGWLVAGVQALQ